MALSARHEAASPLHNYIPSSFSAGLLKSSILTISSSAEKMCPKIHILNPIFLTSSRALQDTPSQTRQQTTSPYSQPSSNSSTAPKPSIIGEMTKKLRTQSSDYVPDKRPLAAQLNIYDDIMDVMSSDLKRRPSPSA
jgi:hypothetical protein